MTNFPPPFAGDKRVIMLDVAMGGQKGLIVMTGDPDKTPDAETVAKVLSLRYRVQATVRMVLEGLSLEAAQKIETAVPQLSAMKQLTQDDVIALLKASMN